MSTNAANVAPMGVDIERVLIGGDLARLTPDQRVLYYNRVCESIGLNPMTRPFDYLSLNGKLVLYARKDCADQLRALKGVSIYRLEQVEAEGLYTVTAYAELANGRKDADTGAVSIANLKGEARANAIMKATTKAKRRVTLSICGLGFLDDTEVETVPGAYRVVVDDAGAVKGPVEGTREAQQAIVDEALKKEAQDFDPNHDGDYPEGAGRPLTKELPATAESIAARRTALEKEAVDALEPHTVKHPPREGAPPAAAKPRKATAPPTVSFDTLESFAALKKEIVAETGNDRLYYEVLKQHNFAKSNLIPDRPTAVKVYKDLGKALTEARKHKANCAELREIGGKCSVDGERLERFWRIMGNRSFSAIDEAEGQPDVLPALLEELRMMVK